MSTSVKDKLHASADFPETVAFFELGGAVCCYEEVERPAANAVTQWEGPCLRAPVTKMQSLEQQAGSVREGLSNKTWWNPVYMFLKYAELFCFGIFTAVYEQRLPHWCNSFPWTSKSRLCETLRRRNWIMFCFCFSGAGLKFYIINTPSCN